MSKNLQRETGTPDPRKNHNPPPKRILPVPPAGSGKGIPVSMQGLPLPPPLKLKSPRPPLKLVPVPETKRPVREPPKRIPSPPKHSFRLRPPATGHPCNPAPLPKSGQWLQGRYQLCERVGDGGAGTVFRARDSLLDASVAVKILHPELTADAAAVAAFKDEARTVMQLSHPNIVQLRNLEYSGTHYFMVMEYIEGQSIADLLRAHGPFDVATVAQILDACADAMSCAHGHGVLHNDMKPGNLLLAHDGVLKIIDFGISCLNNTRQAGYVMGTPEYMSPEQIRGDPLDVRTDIYSLGIITYEMLTGAPPFPADLDLAGILAALPAVFPNAPAQFQPALSRATAPAREDRFGSVREFVGAFTACSG